MRVGSEVSEIRRTDECDIKNFFTERNQSSKMPRMVDLIGNVKQLVEGVVSDVKNLVTHQKSEPAVN